ncbi:hypothetical protein DL764_007500 [Monosporascus ibericus]|uniref:Uncharacterized protein n=1 Tax=Monosporascus ibericus TaxID=155417 RepID=A0A4Q4T0A8_9PEZI|nr:hypothetical protein DL764_007500 [Monosporascus ibericus]
MFSYDGGFEGFPLRRLQKIIQHKGVDITNIGEYKALVCKFVGKLNYPTENPAIPNGKMMLTCTLRNSSTKYVHFINPVTPYEKLIVRALDDVAGVVTDYFALGTIDVMEYDECKRKKIKAYLTNIAKTGSNKNKDSKKSEDKKSKNKDKSENNSKDYVKDNA